MALTKTLEQLIERAERKGTAVKRVRANNIIGNHNSGDTRLVDQWRVMVHRAHQDGVTYKNVVVDHYGTEIAHIIVNETQGTTELYNYYGQSNADRDALNGLCTRYGIDRGFRYRPSIGSFEEVTA